jgi:hypothetical protein
MAVWGAFAFGVVLGWFTYFTNRYRKGEVQFTDLATLLGVIGGGAVTALFGDAKTTLFGAYGLGLAVGFFAYFLTLVVLVRRSKGVFTMAWFLDGRRRRLGDDEEIPEDSRGSGVAMSLQPPAASPLAPRPSPPRVPLAAALAQRDRAITSMLEVLRDLARRIAEEADPDQRRRLQESYGLVSQKLVELVARGLDGLPDAERAMAGSSRPSQE